MTRADFALIERMIVLAITWSRTTMGHKLDSPFAKTAAAKFMMGMEKLREECEDDDGVTQ